MRAERCQRALLAACSLLVGLVVLLLLPAPTASADESTKVLLVLDVSGSMNEKISSGGTKFAAAKRALKRVSAALPAGTQVGLRVYGSQIAEPKAQNPKACTDTKLVLPVGPLDQSRMNAAVDSLTAKGETPIAYSLGKAVDDLGDSGKRVVILISDGEETCSGDPCPTARKLAKAGVDLQFNAIGLAVGGKARKQLQCIVKAGDGNYYDADNTDDLENALRRMTQRALRPFQISGTPVKGTFGPDDAPTLAAGQYRDRVDPHGTELFYRIDRTPGSTVTASIGTIVRPYPMQNVETWNLKLTTADGEACAGTVTTSGSWRAVSVLSGSVSSSQVGPTSHDSPPVPACASSPTLVLSMSRQSPMGNDQDVPVELVIAEEPPITNLADLPDPVTGYTGKASGVSPTKSRPVLGGTSFSNSTEIRPGTWTDTAAVGETVFYRVRLDTGQKLRATATAPNGKSWRLDNGENLTTRVVLYAPDRSFLTVQEKTITANQTATVTAGTPQVRVRNREVPVPLSWLQPNTSSASIAGNYYVAVQLDPLERQLTGRVTPVRLSVAVDGQVSGQPVYADLAQSSAPADSTPTSPASDDPTAPARADRDANGLPAWAVVATEVVIAAGLVTAALILTRRRSGRAGGAGPG